jgi:acetylornithine deacetylase/succinyl-diaminopimelate desuccinylase-like protein
MAHIDVVFPDLTPLPLFEDGDRLCCPGVGDDTANLVAMLMVVKYLLNHPKKGKTGILFVCNAGEEGLGNLKGVREICKTYGSRMKRFYSFDGGLKGVVNKAVGSTRFNVSADTVGGHSYGKFGNPNAIAGLAEVISDIYSLKVPEYGKTTYNVGTISGGTSVNTIAQHAEMLCEYRSSDLRSMAIMEDHFQKIFKERNTNDVHLDVELVGSRPCGALDETARKEQTEMLEQASSILKEYTGKEPTTGAGSTDCNIPLSMNIPSLCYGFYNGQGAHTREEYIEISSLKIGYHVAFESILAYFE